MNYLIFLFITIFFAYIEGKTNFIIILAEDLGYGDVGIYGNGSVKTPNIDNFANEGLKFNNFYSVSPTSTSRYFIIL
jgi:arylsulfatase A